MEHVSFAIINILRKGVESGHWTLDQLDKPSAGWTANTRVDRRTFPSGYMGIEHRNLLRPHDTPERVEVVSPRDFTPPPDPAPPEPNVELDGVTLLTNADPTDLSDLPF